MSTMDTLSHDESVENNDIARQGKLEMERGLAHLRSSKKKEGSFVVGSTAPTLPSNQNEASTQGLEDVSDKNISGPGISGTGGGRTAVPNASGVLPAQIKTLLGFPLTDLLFRRPGSLTRE